MLTGIGWLRRRYGFGRIESRALGWLVAAQLLATVLICAWPVQVPVAVLAPALVAGPLVLGPRELPWLVLVTLLCTPAVIARQPSLTVRLGVALAVVLVISYVIWLGARRREALGVAGIRGEAMLVDLRDRIHRQGAVPALPSGWNVDHALRSAEGTAFAGDFAISARTGDQLDIALLDVSGKGVTAGIRALLLNGAFSGLIGALPAGRFLPAANAHLLRQDWEEGFATAVHASVNLATGAFEVRTAGHPPAVRLHAGSGRWQTLATEGPALGLLADAEFEVVGGRLGPGDLLMLYTDGVVETRERDIASGIDRLVGQTERILHQGGPNRCARLLDRIGAVGDDLALVLLLRE